MATTPRVMTLSEKARVWNSLDDIMRERVRSGELSIAEAAEFTVPMGDLELAAAREAYPVAPAIAAPTPLDTSTPPVAEERGFVDNVRDFLAPAFSPAFRRPGAYDLGTMGQTGAGRLEQAFDAFGASYDSAAAERAENIQKAGGESIVDSITRRWNETEFARDVQATRSGDPRLIGPFDGVFAMAEAGAGALQDQIGATFQSRERTEQERVAAMESLNRNIRQMEEGTRYLSSLPQNPFTSAAVDSLNNGDYGTWAVNIIPAALTAMGEQGLELATSAAIVGGTVAVTRNPAATAVAARAAAGAMSATEYGSDLASLWDEVPENERTVEKFREIQQIAKQAAAGRAVIEMALPGVGAQLGSTNLRRAAIELGLQIGSEALGEDVAQRVKSGTGDTFTDRLLTGEGASAGELVLEAAAGSAGVITEAGPSLRNAAAADKLRALQLEQEQLANEAAFARNMAALRTQRQAEANRVRFDAEGEALRAAEERRQAEALNRGDQMEMPFGSAMAGDRLENDRLPTITDMFSGQETAANRVQAELDRRVPADQMPEETDEAFEIRSQRTSDARNQIDARKQRDFENQKVREEQGRRRVTEAQTTLKRERQLLSTADITREANRLLDVEVEGVRRTRSGIITRPDAMERTLQAYRRQRLPELIENVRNRRLKQVNDARDTVIAEENRQQNLDEIEVQREMDARSEARLAERTAAAQPQLDLIDSAPGQRTLDLSTTANAATPTYTGELTDAQAEIELAAGQLQRQRLMERDRPKAAAAIKAQAAKTAATEQASIDAQLEEATAAVETANTNKATLTQRKYATDRKKALTAAVKAVQTEMPEAVPEVQAREVAGRMAFWSSQNPAPDVPVTAPPDRVGELATKVAGNRETRAKQRETRNLTRALDREMAAGATPEQAAETVRNRQLTPEADADVRRRLGARPSRNATSTEGDASAITDRSDLVVVEQNGASSYRESTALRSALESTLRSRRPNIKSVLDVIVNSPTASTAEKWLASKLAAVADNLGVKLIAAPERDSLNNAGMFIPSTNEMWIRSANIETVLHETLHAITSNLIMSRIARNNPTVRAAVQKLEEAMAVAQAYVRDNPRELTGDAHTRWNAATLNVKEFLAHGMTERPFMQFLQNIPMPGQQSSVWQAFKDAVSSLFRPRNAEQRSVMDAIIEATGELVDFSGANPRVNALADAEIRQRNTRTADLAELPSSPEDDFTNPTLDRTFVGPGNLLRPEWKTRTGEAIADLFTAGGGRVTAGKGVKAKLSEIFERSASETGAYIVRAEQLFKQMDSGLAALAAQNKVSPDTLRSEFNADVAKFEEAKGRLARGVEAANLRKKYGKVSRSYFRARRTIDQLSNEILRLRLDDPTPFTESEADVFTSIKENIGQYYTRVYAANTRGIGEDRAKKLMKEYDAVVKGSGNTDYRDGYNTVRKAIEYIANNDLVIPDTDALERMSMDKLQKLARAWGVRIGTGADLDAPLTTEVRREELIDKLEALQNATPKRRELQARKLAEDLLFARSNAALSHYYRGEGTDRSIVKERAFVPEEIRELLGEYTDLPLKAMTTIIRMASFRSKTKAFNEALEAGRGTTVLTDEELVEKQLSPRDWVQLTSQEYGPLNNMWVRKDIAQRIESTIEVTRTFEQMVAMGEEGSKERGKAVAGWLVEKWMGAAGMIKQVQLIFNASNAVLNYAGGGLILASNGNTSPGSVTRAHKIAVDLISAQASGRLSPDMEKVIRAGITDNAMLGAVRKVELEKLEEVLFYNLRSKTEKLKEKAVQKAFTAGRTWREVYAMADVVWKIANFLDTEAKLTEYYKANGDSVSPEAIEREAAWRTNLANFSYKRVPNFLKDVEKAGLTYVMPYVYETFRSLAGSFLVAVSDFKMATAAKTPEARNIMLVSGSKRALGSVLAMGAMQQGIFFLANMVADSLGESDEEQREWIEKLKVFLPDFKKYADYFYMGRNSRGEPVLFEYSRLDPFGPATEFYRMAVGGAKPEEYLEAMKNLVIENPYGAGILKAFLGQSGTNTRLEDISPEWYDALVRVLGTRGVKALDVILPSAVIRPFDRNNLPAENDNIFGPVFTAMGGQLTNVQPARSLQFAAMRYEEGKDEIREQFYTDLKKRTDLNDNDLLAILVDLREQEAKMFDELSNTYNGMLELGFSPQQSAAALVEAGVKKEDIGNVALGYRPERSGIVSISGLERSYEQMGDVSPERREKYLNNIRRLLRLVEEGRVPARRK